MSFEMLWYALLVGVAVALFAAIFTAHALHHRRYMKALEILKSYADKGIEPPAAVTALLLQPISEAAERKVVDRATARATAQSTAQITRFMTLLLTACVAAGVVWGLVEGGGLKKIAVAVAIAFAVFLGVGALGSFILALTTGLFQRSFLHRTAVGEDASEDK